MQAWRIKMVQGIDLLLGLAFVALLLGSSLAFGGQVWWARVVIVGLAGLIGVGWLARTAIVGHWRITRSPMMALGMLVVGFALVQVVPMPSMAVGPLSRRALTLNSSGVLADLASTDAPTIALAEPTGTRTPLSVDRGATLRWAVGAMACLGVFWVSSHFADRLEHSRVLWGSVIAAFFVNVVFGLVQLSGDLGGLYGFITPGSAPIWGPNPDDAARPPMPTVVRKVDAEETRPGRPALSAATPVPQVAVGSLMGGPGAFLAQASLAVPLALGLLFQLVAPRGGRDGFLARLRDSGQLSQVILILGLVGTSLLLVGIYGGWVGSIPFLAEVVLVGLLGTWRSGVRKVGLAVSTGFVLAILAGIWINEPSRNLHLPRIDQQGARATWAEGLRIARDFPVVGTGFGTFAAIHPYYKRSDVAPNSAMSSAIQWGAESGAVGVGLVLVGLAWGAIRLPRAIGRVGTADRALCFGLLASVVGFGMFSAIHWTIELPAIALAASAVAGSANRWLAGATDLFVERG